jgi:hypothetical protein
MGLLNLYLANLEQLNILDPDLVTQYPSTNTGTPTSTANPGPLTPFDQVYSATNTYLEYIQNVNNSINENDSLLNSFDKTNLDTENPSVDGGIPYRPDKDPTEYPVTTTGAESLRGYFPAPSKPAQKYGVRTTIADNAVFDAQNTYSDFIKEYIS